MNFCPNCGKKVDQFARFCCFCGQPITADTQSDNRLNNSYNDRTTQQYTCPQCGAPINSFSAICPNCECEINTKKYSKNCKELCDKLDQIEASRPPKNLLSMVAGFVNKAMNQRDVVDEFDRRKIELVSSFIIDSNKIEILDFIILANSRIATCERMIEMCSSDDNTKMAQRQLKEAWNIKLNEAINRAEMVLKNDRDFSELKRTIIRERSKRFMKEGLCSYCGGNFKGIFNRVCESCGKPKNY